MTVFPAFLHLLADATAAPAAPGAVSGTPATPPTFWEQLFSGNMFLFIPLMIAAYMLILRPERNRQKALQARISALEPGQKVVTAFGVHGFVHSVKEKTVMLKIAEGTLIECDKAAIGSIQPKTSGEAKK